MSDNIVGRSAQVPFSLSTSWLLLTPSKWLDMFHLVAVCVLCDGGGSGEIKIKRFFFWENPLMLLLLLGVCVCVCVC